MTEKASETRTIKYGGKTFELTAAASTFMDAVMNPADGREGLDEGTAFSALQAAMGAGIVKVAAKPKEYVPNVAELAQPVVDRGLKRNKSLQAAVAAYGEAQVTLDALASEAGLGDGYSYLGEFRTEFCRIGRNGDADSGVRDVVVTLKNDSGLGSAAKALLDTHRTASSAVQKIVNGVAKKHDIDPVPTVGISLDGDTITLSQKAKRGGGGGGGGGPKAKFKVDIAQDGNITISMTWKEKDYGKIAEGKTGTELLDQIKAQHAAVGKTYYKAAWDRKDWWPEG